MLSLPILLLVTVTFVFGGFVKGVIGLGLPVVALAFLAPVLGVKAAMAIMLVPCIVANIWQGLAGGYLHLLLKRLWLFLALAAVGVGIGVKVLATAPGPFVTAVFGVALCLYSWFSLTKPQISPPGRHEWWGSPVAGGLGGVMFGLTGSFIVPGILYLQALGLGRNLFVQAMGLTFITISVMLGLALSQNDLLPADTLIVSTLALVPTAIGVLAGQRYRHRVSEEVFRRLFFTGLLMVGVFMIVRSPWAG